MNGRGTNEQPGGVVRARNRPVEVDVARIADLLDAAQNDWSALPKWVRAGYETGKILFLTNSINVRTLTGVIRAPATDWLVQGVHGELYPCDAAVFAETFEVI